MLIMGISLYAKLGFLKKSKDAVDFRKKKSIRLATIYIRKNTNMNSIEQKEQDLIDRKMDSDWDLCQDEVEVKLISLKKALDYFDLNI